MRITVQMKPEHRSALQALAARRGEKGLSSVLAEAIAEYLDEEKTRVLRRKELLSLAGSLSAEEARSLRNSAASLREN
jgi:metal-responsive CopG/Arc/MetJ family transcriptional regulator